MMNYFIYTALFTGILVISILIIYSVNVQRNNLLLAACLICLWYSLFASWLISSGKIADLPFLGGFGNLFAYMIYPFLYLFARNVFYPGRLWRRTDFLFLVPVLFYIIDFLPYFFSSNTEKVAMLRPDLVTLPANYVYKEGWITPLHFHYVFRVLWCAFNYMLLVIVLYQNWRFEKELPNQANKSVFRFILMFAVMFFPLTAILLYGTLSGSSWWNVDFLAISLGCPLLAAGIFLLFTPGPLYGFRPLGYTGTLKKADTNIEEQTTGPDAATTITAPAEKELPPPKSADNKMLAAYASQLMACMESDKPFKEPGFTIHKLAELSGIPVYMISNIVNQHLHTSFTSWVNNYRIQYFLMLNADPLMKQFTVEALALKSGFTNRVTFSAVFKREMGESPAKYLKSRPDVVQ